MALAGIRNLVEDDLNATDQFIKSQLHSDIPLIQEVVQYVLDCGGKRVRPLILLLSARSVATHPQQHIDLAAVIELIHTATLLHDDVIDDSNMRRGHKTAHTIWGSAASVLIGDFLYSRAFQIVVDLKHADILSIFAEATHFIAQGEIMQLVNCHNADTTEAMYFDIINRKTAKLFEVAAQLGATIAQVQPHQIEALRLYGLHVGMAYQLIDDALDYSQPAEQTGKKWVKI